MVWKTKSTKAEGILMRIGVVGTRGIPNNHGGFEQFTEYFAKGMVERGHEVFVYCPHDHPFTENTWNGINLIHKHDPEYKMGTAGQFIYDFNCIVDSRKRNFDIILQLGYTSSSIWNWLFPRKSIIVTNMDGLEWKRSKYNKPTQKFLQVAERLAVVFSDYLIADSIGIQNYLKKKYKVDSSFIAYGADLFTAPAREPLAEFKLQPYSYDMILARLEPENNIETILAGFEKSLTERTLIIVGNHETSYGEYLKNKFTDKRIKFLGKIYDINKLNNLRYYSNLYFHGHSVGGTNPSLLEAMASDALICAHNNEFNSSVLSNNAYYFETSENVTKLIDTITRSNSIGVFESGNKAKIANEYSWDKINSDCERLFNEISLKKNK